MNSATKYSINILGEYNIGGDGWEQERILKKSATKWFRFSPVTEKWNA